MYMFSYYEIYHICYKKDLCCFQIYVKYHLNNNNLAYFFKKHLLKGDYYGKSYY